MKMQWIRLVTAGVLCVAIELSAIAEPIVSRAMVPMRDGVELITRIYEPQASGPHPVVLMRTPYPEMLVQTFVEPERYTDHGYTFIMQSSRGTGGSEGDYVPFSHARPDAQDTLDWIAGQGFSSGSVGVTGGSAMGITANFAASTRHPSIKAAYVIVAPQSTFHESTFVGGVFKKSQVERWMMLQRAPQMVDEFRSRPTLDERWERDDFVSYLPQIEVPVYNVGGWFDIFQRGTIANFQYLQYEGAPGARGNQKLYVGAFGHLALEGELEYPAAGSLMELDGREELRWFDYWLRGIDNGIMDEPAVKLYVMASARIGAPSEKNRLIRTDHWPLEGQEVAFYLREGGVLSPEASPVVGETTSYVFDPKNPVPTMGGANLFLPSGPLDQRGVGERPDYLRFQTPPLENDVAVVGPVRVELFAATDAPDTDFMVKLVDVYPDGYEALLLDAPIRARFRNGRRPEAVAMMPPNEPQRMVVDLWNTANIFEKGHRIAVHVSSSNFPRFEVNPNTGHTPGEKNGEFRTANNVLHHDADHPSALHVRVVDVDTVLGQSVAATPSE